MAKAPFSMKKTVFVSKMDSILRKTFVKCYIWSIGLCGGETWTIRRVDRIYLEVLKCGAGEGWRRSVEPIV